MLRKISTAAVVTLLCCSPALAQGSLRFQIGAGPTPNSIDGYDTGGHLMASASAFLPGSFLGIRLDGIATVARYEYFGWLPDEDQYEVEPRMLDRGLEPIVGGSLSVVLQRRSGSYRPYGFVGLGYYNSPWSEGRPSGHDFGPTLGAGVVKEIAGLEWFIQMDARVFGNTFVDRGADKTFWPLTVGLQF